MTKEEALAIAKTWNFLKDKNKEALETLVPELQPQESEDEKIKKALISFVGNDGWKFTKLTKEEKESWIAWIEKQCKEEYALKSSKHEDVYKFMEYIEKEAKAYDFNLPNRGYDIYAFAKDILVWLEKHYKKESDPRYKILEELIYADDIYQMSINDKMIQEAKEKAVNAISEIGISKLLGLEKQYEWIPVLIIPKFRVGDEIKTSNEESLTITKIDEKGYWSEDLFICDFDEECLWDLAEKKPDVKNEPKLTKEDIDNLNKISKVIYEAGQVQCWYRGERIISTEESDRLCDWLKSFYNKLNLL